jgi:hypothetical protein
MRAGRRVHLIPAGVPSSGLLDLSSSALSVIPLLPNLFYFRGSHRKKQAEVGPMQHAVARWDRRQVMSLERTVGDSMRTKAGE